MKELTIDEIKKREFEILCTVDKFCREHNIKYILDFGTLLGAVRHKGFIPWDDDMDISMLREDYERFLSEFNKDRNDSLKALHFSTDSNYPDSVCRICDSKNKVVFADDPNPKYSRGLCVDLFVYDNIGNDKSNAYKLYKKSWFARKVGYVQSYKTRLRKNVIKMILLLILKPISYLFPKNYEVKITDNYARTYENEESQYAAIINFFRSEKHHIVEKSIFDNLIELEFEGRKFFAPKNYDAVLTDAYGDYMTPPPIEEQIGHGFKAYLLD